MDRKAFFETAGRWGMLGLMALLVGIFIKRKALSLDPECDPKFCDSCSKRNSCEKR
ncbi:MAG: hypothetical protein U9N86_04090 [Bacteroidota bacterium]|nr:hypothetical protein [Bacteroidota bacterium]